jgi:Putative Ig domain
MRLSWFGRGARAAVAGVVLAGGCVLAVSTLAGAAEAAGAVSGRTAGPSGRAAPAGGVAAATPAGQNHKFGSFPAAEYLHCTGSAKITGSFSLDVTGVTGTFKKWTNGDHNHEFTASLGLTTSISASVDVSADTTCTPGKALLKVTAVKFVIDGVRVELRPDFYLEISAEGSVTASRSITQSLTLTGRLGGSVNKPSYSISRGNPVVTASGSAAFTAVIGGEAEILAGVLDLDFALMGGVEATAQASLGEVCVTGYPALRATVTVGVTFFGWNPQTSLVDDTWEIKSIAGHSTKFSLCTYTRPKIVTTTLPIAAVGEQYSAELTTADHRNGTWKITSGKLPPGLALSGHTVSGTPTTAGTDSFQVTFTDAHGKTATATVTVKVTPVAITTSGTAIEVPGTAALNVSGYAQVTSVSCPSAGNCSAGGYYQEGAADRYDVQAFVADEVNGSWHDAIEVPGTAALNDGWAEVTSLSCASAGNCAVGGFYQDGGSGQVFVADEVDGAWHNAVEVPGTAASAGQSAALTSVSCASAGNCVAGGAYYPGSSDAAQPFVADEVDGAWHDAVQVPAAGEPGPGGMVTSVSCASAGNCSIAGESGDEPFLAGEVNGTWHDAIQVPGLAALNTGGYPSVTSVSCASAGNCAAGGRYAVGSSESYPFVADEVGGIWHAAAKIIGDGALSGGYGTVTSVSCASAGNCVAGGGQQDLANDYQPFVANEIDGTWHGAVEIPGTPRLNIGGTAEVVSVSCGSSGNCAADGDYVDGSPAEAASSQAFVAEEVKGAWEDAVKIPGMAALNAAGMMLTSASCPPAGQCAAGGYYFDSPTASSTGPTQAFVTSP